MAIRVPKRCRKMWVAVDAEEIETRKGGERARSRSVAGNARLALALARRPKLERAAPSRFSRQ